MTKPIRSLSQKKVTQNIIDALVDHILDNDFTEGDKLPSQSMLADQMGVSRTSLREALAQLEARGVIEQVQGVGTFVTSDPEEPTPVVELETSVTEMIRAMGKTPGTSKTITEYRQPFPEFDECFPGHDELISVQRTRTADGEPFAVSYAFLRPGLIEAPADIEQIVKYESLHNFVNEYCDHYLMYFEDNIEIAHPTPEVAQELDIPESKPIFKFIRYHYDSDRNLIILSADYFNLKTIQVKTTLYKLFTD